MSKRVWWSHRYKPFYNLWVLYLVIVKLAVLEVGGGGDAAHAGVGVVEGVLAHTVGETLLGEIFREQEGCRMMSGHLGDFQRRSGSQCKVNTRPWLAFCI